MSSDRVANLEARVQILEAREGVLAATFIGSASAAGDKLTVRIPDYDEGEHAHGVPDGVVWAPRASDDGLVYPQDGDEAHVVESSSGAWVVIAWKPTGGA